MSAYAKESLGKVRKVVPMPTSMGHIRMIIEEIERMKKLIVLTEYNLDMPYVIKTKRLRELRESLFLSEHLALKLMQEEIEAGEGDGFQ